MWLHIPLDLPRSLECSPRDSGAMTTRCHSWVRGLLRLPPTLHQAWQEHHSEAYTHHKRLESFIATSTVAVLLRTIKTARHPWSDRPKLRSLGRGPGAKESLLPDDRVTGLGLLQAKNATRTNTNVHGREENDQRS
mmetsp:Transcript_4097/g.8451  ORF Transcript_4097/g.8451 Transcript_4097/m.8451 type:complete len:136 (-) Transcript_4097:133-540(-)